MKFKIKKKKYIIVPAIIIIVIAAAVLFINNANANKKAMSKSINEAKATVQNLVSTITGTATITPKDQYSITSLVSGDIIYAGFEEGDMVNKGDLLYKIDSKNAAKGVSSAEVSLRKAELQYSEAVKNKNDLNVASDVSGVIKTLKVKLGDTVQSGAVIAQVYDDSYMELTLPFNESDIPNIHTGDGAVIKIANTSDTVYGTVTSIKNASYAKTGNMLVQDVIIKVKNPGTITTSDSATAYIGSVSCNDSGKFAYVTEKTITAKTSGDVSSIIIKEGNRVKAGETIVTLNNDTVNSTISSNELSVEESRIAKSKAVDQLDNYTITAPISGKVVTKTIKEGDKLDTSNASTVMAVIYDLSSLKFDISVDELDINKISVGQEVSIAADALAGKTYKGYISNISISGTTSNGVTTYPVTVEIADFDDNLLPGMNIDATIVVANADNVLSVPVSAVQRNNLVYVKGEKEDTNDKAPQGYKSVKVETGLYTDEFIEIKSGLNDGDIVWVEAQKSDLPGMMGGNMHGDSGGPDGSSGSSGGGSKTSGGNSKASGGSTGTNPR